MYVGTGILAATVFVAGAAFYSFVWPAPPPFVRLLVEPTTDRFETEPLPSDTSQDEIVSSAIIGGPDNLKGAPIFVSGQLFGTVNSVVDYGKPKSSVTIDVNPTAGEFLTFDPPEVPKLILLPFNLLEWHRDPKAPTSFFAEFRFQTQKDGVLTTLAKDLSHSKEPVRYRETPNR